jgi:peptide/nickel transport system permease protein
MEAGLSFLGYGVQPPIPSWGGMIAEGRNELLIAPHIVTAAGGAIVITVLCLNLVGDALREALDPRSH